MSNGTPIVPPIYVIVIFGAQQGGATPGGSPPVMPPMVFPQAQHAGGMPPTWILPPIIVIEGSHGAGAAGGAGGAGGGAPMVFPFMPSFPVIVAAAHGGAPQAAAPA